MKQQSRNNARGHRVTPSEPIRPGEVWPIGLLHERLGWGARTRAQAIRQGLPVYRWGKRHYVYTDDVIALLTRQRLAEKSTDDSSGNEGS